MSIYDDLTFYIILCVAAAMLGAVFGSFLNCAAWRITHGESFIKGHSRCPKCGHELKALDLIPIFSWIFLRGKCRYCKAVIPIRYPATEAIFSLITVLCLLRFDLTVTALVNFIFLCCLFCLTITDLEDQIIPNGCVIIPAAAWVIGALLPGMAWKDVGLHVLSGVVFGGGMLLISLIMDKVLKRDSMGGGDIKLFAVMGLYLGFVQSLFALILSCVLGLIFALVRKLVKKDSDRAFPFGPSIAVATAIMLFCGEWITGWYTGLLGL
ncbi:MAG: prepilin peptidase [Clostridia bacterium]|nr:prepilin peptidase [Clostridia bacterium]